MGLVGFMMDVHVNCLPVCHVYELHLLHNHYSKAHFLPTPKVCATKLKCTPSHEQLLVDYANRGEYLMNAGHLTALGYSAAAAEGALVVHDGNNPIKGNELVAFQPGNSMNSSQQPNPFMMPAMGVDVNAPFSGILPEEERPTHIADCKYIDSVLAMPSYAKLNSMELFNSSKDVSVSMAALDAVRLYGTVEGEYFAPHDGDGNKVIPRSMRKNMAAGVESPDNLNSVNPKSIACLVIGEGSLPRTAVLASIHYGWTTLSIDPTLSEEWDGYQDDVPNYTGYSGTISEFMSDEYTNSCLELGSSQSEVRHLVIVGIQMTKDQLRLKGRSNINEIRARFDDVPTTLVSMSPLRKATLAPKRRSGQCGSKLEKDVGYEPNCSYIDEGVFSACRLVEVWNFHNEDGGDEGCESGGQTEYTKESIDDNRRNGRQRFSMEQLSAEDMSKGSDYVNKRFQEHVSRYDDGNEQQEVEKIQFGRKNTMDSMSTVSTKGMLPVNDHPKKRSSTRHQSNREDKSGAVVLSINSRLEAENSRRKSRKKSKRRDKRSASGPRPIPDDIPKGVEIDPDNFVGEGILQARPEELTEWNNVLTHGNQLQEMAAGVGSEHIESHTDKESSYKSYEFPVGDYYPGDADRGTLDSNQAEEYYGISEGVRNKLRLEHGDERSHQSEYSDDHNPCIKGEKGGYNDCDDEPTQSVSYHSSYCNDERGDQRSYHSHQSYEQSDQRSYHSNYSNGSNGGGDHAEQHSSNEQDRVPIRSKTGDYSFDQDEDSNYVYDDYSTGADVLQEFNQSRNQLRECSDAEEYEEDDQFHVPEYLGREDDQVVERSTSSGSLGKFKPWHDTKEKFGNSFMSFDSNCYE